MSGYDPLAEISDALDEVTAAPNRSIGIAPPPPPPPPTTPLTSPTEEPAIAAAPAEPAPARPAATPPRSLVRRRAPDSRLAARGATESMRNTTTTIPRPILDRLQQLRLDRDVTGRPLRIVEVFNEAIQNLPTDPKELVGELERNLHQLNVGRRPTDDGFIPEGRFATRLSAESERHLATVIRSLYTYLGRRIDRQDLWALTLLGIVSDS